MTGYDHTRSRDLIVLDGTTFFFSDPTGDAGTADAHGYIYDDVRHLSVWELRVDGEPLLGVTSCAVDYFSARIVLAPNAQDSTFAVRRDRFVSEGVHEDLVVTKPRGSRAPTRARAALRRRLRGRDGGAVGCAPARRR